MIDLNKKYTSNGCEVVGIFHYPENPEDRRLIVHRKDLDDGDIDSISTCENGRFYSNHDDDNDLIEVKTRDQLIEEAAAEFLKSGTVSLSDPAGYYSTLYIKSVIRNAFFAGVYAAKDIPNE